MAAPDTDRNLLFGVLAMQQDLIDPHQFADACAGWAVRKDNPLADILIERGWITQDDRRHVERFLERKLKRYGGDVRASLAAVADVVARDVIRAVDDPEVRNSLSSLPPAAGIVLVETLIPTTQERSRYRLTRLHAEGGVGRVWVAHDGDLNRDVALKEIRPEQAGHPEAWRRFLKEAQVTGQLEHPGIVPVYELARRPEDDQPFYTMRFVKGGTLRQAIADHHARPAAAKADPLDRFKLLQSFVAACQAVGYAHSRGVIHRDLKPENVVLDDFGVVMVLDWGLARMVDRPDEDVEILPDVSVTDEAKADATRANTLLGTPAYMAPEQAEGRNDLVDARTDVYGLGAILFEILTGQPPHDGADTAELLHRVVTGDTPRVRQIAASVPLALDAICGLAMSRSRADRYGSASELAEDVQRWLVDEPVSAFREGLSRRVARWARRNRSWVQAGVAALFLVAVVATASAFAINAARSKTAAALAAENAAKIDAQENFQAARRAVQDYLTGISENTLLKQQDRADLRALRKELLEGAARYYKGFIEKHAEDPKLQAELADAYYRVGFITDDIGSKREALRAHEQARAIRQKLADTNPSDKRIVSLLAASHNEIGMLRSETGQPAEAMRSYEQALAIRQKLADDNASVSEFQDRLAETLNNIGNLQSATGQPAEALRSLERALVLRQKLADDNPAVVEYQGELATSHNNIGILQRASGHPADALKSYERALAISQKLTDANPTVTKFQGILASTHHSIGLVQTDTGQTAEALESYERALSIRQKIVDDNASVIEFQDRLAETLNNTGNLHRVTGHPAEALLSYRRALAVKQKLADANPTVTRFQSAMALSHNNIGAVQVQIGQPAEAMRSFEHALAIRQKLADANPTVTRFQSDVAQTHYNIGVRHMEFREPALALRSFKRAVVIVQKLADSNPSVTDFQNILGGSLSGIAFVQSEMGEPAEALKSYERVSAIQQKLADSNPSVTDFQSRLAASLNTIGTLQIEVGRRGQAQRSFERALAISQKLTEANPSFNEFQDGLATAYANVGTIQRDTGHLSAAFRSTKKGLLIWETIAGTKPERFYYTACLFSTICAKSSPEVDAAEAAYLAMRALRRAVNAGFRDAAQAVKDTDLDPLRSRPDFQVLMMDLAFPADPFARGK